MTKPRYEHAETLQDTQILIPPGPSQDNPQSLTSSSFEYVLGSVGSPYIVPSSTQSRLSDPDE